jgi:hypothetical protein
LLVPAGRGELHTISPSWLWCGYRAYRETVPISQKSRDSKKKNCLLNLCNNGTCSQCNTNTHNTSSSLSYGGTLSSSGNRIMVSPDRIWLSIHLQTWGPVHDLAGRTELGLFKWPEDWERKEKTAHE